MGIEPTSPLFGDSVRWTCGPSPVAPAIRRWHDRLDFSGRTQRGRSDAEACPVRWSFTLMETQSKPVLMISAANRPGTLTSPEQVLSSTSVRGNVIARVTKGMTGGRSLCHPWPSTASGVSCPEGHQRSWVPWPSATDTSRRSTARSLSSATLETTGITKLDVWNVSRVRKPQITCLPGGPVLLFETRLVVRFFCFGHDQPFQN